MLLRCLFLCLAVVEGSYSVECSGIRFRRVLFGMGGGVAWSKDALSDERDDSRLLMPAGMFFVVIGGWLLL